MDVLEGSFAVAVFVVLALPGLVFVAVRRWASGEGAEDRDFGLSLARGTVFALALTSVYLLFLADFFGRTIATGADADTLVIKDARTLAFIVLFFYILLPGAISILWNRRHIVWKRTRKVKWIWLPQSKHGYTDTPGPWDHAARKHQSSWVKVKRASGEWIGGWVTNGSFISAYPEPHAIYIDQQYAMTDDGNYTAKIDGAGLFMTIADNDIVIWTRTTVETQNGEAHE